MAAFALPAWAYFTHTHMQLKILTPLEMGFNPNTPT